MLKRLLPPAEPALRAAFPAPFPSAPPPRAPGGAVLSDAWWLWLSALVSARGPRSRP
jgi:hypothetical protein